MPEDQDLLLLDSKPDEKKTSEDPVFESRLKKIFHKIEDHKHNSINFPDYMILEDITGTYV